MKKMKLRTWVKVAIILILLAAIGVLATPVFNLYEIEFDLGGQEKVVWEYGVPYEDAPVTCYRKAILMPTYKEELQFDKSDNIDVNKLGVYQVVYHATDGKQEKVARRTVSVEDHTPPVIELITDPDHYTLPGHEYQEEGYTVTDNYDGDISDHMQSSNDGEYIHYTARDNHGNVAEAERFIIYDDRKGPVITLDGGSSVTIARGRNFSNGYSAVDDLDGDVTANVKVEGSVDTSTEGTYTLKYTVSDSYGNVSEATRTVRVVGSQGVVYLTFDDGPSGYTPRLLDILDKYNVKATFFVTNAFPGSIYNIKRAYESGHTIAVHSYTHNYAQIYSSDDAYWADFEAMEDIIVAQTGHRTNLFRFPGGSSNTVSRNYSYGIMSRLTDQAYRKGYVYFDWNVASGDAGETTSSSVVYQNIIDGVSRMNTSVVLCHDSKGYTVDAIEDVIIWCLDHGYTLLPLDANSFTAHHGVNN
ncbi:MAG: polysaccharide deacetylase family protein [Erysipelotrichaceae bacterium]|nr:polysaccharide deacetylase family protein [Erysipelotrichaceae bacterium]